MAVRIYVDQGHNPGYPNAGAEGNGLREQDITYRVGAELAKLLESDPAFAVRLSRPTADTVLGSTNTGSLVARVRDANDWGADAFVSIHVNSSDNAQANGGEAFAFSRSSKGYPLGESILAGVVEESGFRNRGMKIRPDLYVLRKTKMPAVLVELGFITNKKEAALMSSNPNLFAQGIYRGIKNYYGA